MTFGDLLHASMQVDSGDFERRGYARVHGLMPREVLDIAFRYFLSYVAVPGYYDGDIRFRALDRYADALGEAMIPTVQARLESVIGRALLPTSSFVRIYTTESILKKHVDRNACEYSATMTVGYRNAEGLWPIFVESENENIAVELDVGDAMVYKGMAIPHWREALPRGIWCQLFFHFVAADGPFSTHVYDGREHLGPKLEMSPAS
jgi:hypothetical protein